MVELPLEFRTAGRSYHLWGRSSHAGHVLAFALAKFGDESFRWLSVRDSPAQPTEEEEWVRSLLPENRVLAPLSSLELTPGRPVSKEVLDSLIRTDGETSERTSLDHYLLLPPRLQNLLDEVDARSPLRAIVVANAERIQRFYPTDPGRMRPFADVFSRHGISMISTSLPPPYEGRYAFDIVLRIDGSSTGDWRSGRLVVEKGLRSGEFRTGSTYSLEELPWYTKAGTAIERAET